MNSPFLTIPVCIVTKQKENVFQLSMFYIYIFYYQSKVHNAHTLQDTTLILDIKYNV